MEKERESGGVLTYKPALGVQVGNFGQETERRRESSRRTDLDSPHSECSLKIQVGNRERERKKTDICTDLYTPPPECR